jgi:hypothetical protein
LIVQADSNLRRNDIVDYVRQVIDIFVHLERTDGRRRIDHILDLRSMGGSTAKE